WVARYNGPGNSSDVANSLAVSIGGEVYVTGASTGIGTGTDCTTVKYDSLGAQQWVARYNGIANRSDSGKVVKLDTAGNVLVSGDLMNGANGVFADTYVTIKYSPSGTQLWVA